LVSIKSISCIIYNKNELSRRPTQFVQQGRHIQLSLETTRELNQTTTAKNLGIDVFPLITAADALLQGLDTRLYIAGKDTIEVDLLAASTNGLVTQLYMHSRQPPTLKTCNCYI